MDFFQREGQNCLYVADNPTKDFVAAKKINWHTIQISRKNGEYGKASVDKYHQADEVIHTLYDLEMLI